jgi:hypothetical protein
VALAREALESGAGTRALDALRTAFTSGSPATAS